MLKSDTEIGWDVNDELQWSRDLDASDIAVSVRDGVVTLAGFVKGCIDKYEAAYAAKRAPHVVGDANDLEVRLLVSTSGPIPTSRATLSRHSRASCREREEAECAAWAAPGVTKVDDQIVVSP